MPIPSARRILLCLRYGIGDVIMELPVLESLRAAAPSSRLEVLAARPATELLKGDPRIDGLHAVQQWGVTHWGDVGTPAIRRYFRNWIERNFDLVLDPSHAAIALREAIREGGTEVLDSGGSHQDEALAAGHRGAPAIKEAVRRGWGMEVPEALRPRLHMEAADSDFADRFLAPLCPERLRVALSPAASSPLKRWPVERLAAVADLLVEDFDAEILLFNGPEEESLGEFLAAVTYPERIRVAANLHLRRVGALLSRSELLVCNDTGLMHMGGALGLAVIALFGPTSPGIYFPGGDGLSALGGTWPCAYRMEGSFGPPECLVRGECLKGLRSCIDAVRLEEVARPLRGRLGSPSARALNPRAFAGEAQSRSLNSNLRDV